MLEAFNPFSIFPAAISSAANYFGTQATNEQNAENARFAAGVNAEQAQINRAFNAHEAAVARNFGAGQALEARNWSADQARQAREFDWQQNVTAREFATSEAEKARYANAEQADIARQFNAGEALKQRSWESEQAAIARGYNTNEAVAARQWQERMSSTAYQRATADMRAAGINPMVAYMQGGASTPSGSMASTGIPSGASATGPAASSAAASAGQAHATAPGASSAGSSSASYSGGNIMSPARFENALQNAFNSALDWSKGMPLIKGLWQDLQTKIHETEVRRGDAELRPKDLRLRVAQGDNVDQDTLLLKQKRATEAEETRKRAAEAAEAESRVPRSMIEGEYYRGKVGQYTRRIHEGFRDLTPMISSAKDINDVIKGWMPDFGSVDQEWSRGHKTTTTRKGKWQ